MGIFCVPSPLDTLQSSQDCCCYETANTTNVMNQLDPIEELYDMYSEEEDTPRIVEIENDGLDFVSDVEGPANPYMDL